MKFLHISLAFLLAVASGKKVLASLNDEWEDFKVKYGRKYDSPEEEERRKTIFTQNVEEINAQNKLYEEGKSTYFMCINEIADRTFEEVKDAKNCVNLDESNPNRVIPNITYEIIDGIRNIPTVLDWRKIGIVSPVQNEGKCKACWAFSAAGSLEGIYALTKKKQLASLSVQNLVDCSDSEGNQGCDGGEPYKAFNYIVSNDKHGIDRADKYPYTGRKGPCQYNPKYIGATMTKLKGVPRNETSLAQAVANIGPIAVVLRSNRKAFAYCGGVFQDDREDLHIIYSAGLIIGYNVDQKFGKYWIVQVSSGEIPGKGGIWWISKDHNNSFGIANEAIYPIVD